MDVDLFDFELPKELIAEKPADPRDAARLLDVTADVFADRIVRDLPGCLQPGDVLVSNDTRVIPARLLGKRGEAGVEVTLHLQTGLNRWRAFAKPAKKLTPGDRYDITPDFWATVIDKVDGGEVTLDFNVGGGDLIMALETHGIMPLPPYIKRPKGGDAKDKERYQTIFAKHDGAVAAPTAGLHFTDRLLDALAERGVTRETVTLHVGAGTFLPVKVQDTKDHKMHAEWGRVTEEVAERLNKAKRDGGRIVAVGTTSLRLLESAVDADGVIRPFQDETDIFITPGFQFRAVDVLMTNFHLPKSTLMMLVSAFAGMEKMKRAYDHAVDKGYRFYSYGDACLLSRGE